MEHYVWGSENVTLVSDQPTEVTLEFEYQYCLFISYANLRKLHKLSEPLFSYLGKLEICHMAGKRIM